MVPTSASPRPRPAVVACLLLLLACLPAAAQPGEDLAAADLKELSLEELLDLEVTSVVKRPQRWLDAAAAVTVITGDEIRRSGVRTLADALRLAPGIHVARADGGTWAISARGLNITTANKMLVLIDGRSVYTPLFSGVFWDVQAPMLEDLERIEVIRGPAGTLWGANAVNGVVNVITRAAVATQGGLLVAGAGDEERGFGALRWGGATTRGHYRVYGKIDDHDALALAGGGSAEDPLRLAQGGFRVDLAAAGEALLTVQGDLYQGRLGDPLRSDTDVDGGNLLGHWTRPLAGGSRLEVRGYYDHTYRRVPGQFEEDRGTWDLELQQTLERGRHELLWGGGYRLSEDRVVSSPVVAFEPARESAWVANAFLQDEIALGREWRLVAGAKLEEHSTMDLEVMPSLRVAWAPRDHALLWAGAARALRAPTRLDRDVRLLAGGVPVVLGSRVFEPEEVLSYEAGYRWAGLPDWVVDLTGFYNDYSDLRSLEPTAGGPLVLDNLLEGETEGATLAANWRARTGVRLRGGVTWLDTDLRLQPGGRDLNAATGEANDPRWHGFLRADLDLPRQLELGLWLRGVDNLPAPAVPAYTELDVRLGWRTRPDLVVSLVGQNLLHDSHPEFGPAAGRGEVERGFYGQVSWSF